MHTRGCLTGQSGFRSDPLDQSKQQFPGRLATIQSCSNTHPHPSTYLLTHPHPHPHPPTPTPTPTHTHTYPPPHPYPHTSTHTSTHTHPHTSTHTHTHTHTHPNPHTQNTYEVYFLEYKLHLVFLSRNTDIYPINYHHQFDHCCIRQTDFVLGGLLVFKVPLINTLHIHSMHTYTTCTHTHIHSMHIHTHSMHTHTRTHMHTHTNTHRHTHTCMHVRMHAHSLTHAHTTPVHVSMQDNHLPIVEWLSLGLTVQRTRPGHSSIA